MTYELPRSRLATPEEVFETFEYRKGYRVQFEHFVREVADKRTRTGVRHVRYGRSRIVNVYGTPCVRYRGCLEPVVARVYTLASGKTFVAGFVLADLAKIEGWTGV